MLYMPLLLCTEETSEEAKHFHLEYNKIYSKINLDCF